MVFPLKKPTILIVDDMPINVQILARTLKSFYNIKVATSGKKALDIAASDNPPDLILLDIMMPEMDGYDVIRKLKQNSQTRNIPVIFITIKDEDEDEFRGLELGAVDYITKPFYLPVVMARIKTQIELKNKTELLERLVSIDGLTHIPNRRHYDDIIVKEWKRAQRNSTPLSVIMIDIDCFKNYNDTYGHAAGDECIRSVARTLEESMVRPGDTIARYGGEEFVAVLPETDAQGAKVLAERMRHNVESIQIDHCDSIVADHVTISSGIATMIPTHHHSYIDLLNAADRQLYKAKEKGRNQTECKLIG